MIANRKTEVLSMRRITKWIVWIGVGGALYYVSANHFIYLGGMNVKLLKKKQLTLSNTFFSTELKTPEIILKDDVLREAGIADLLVEEGLLAEERKKALLEKYETQGDK
jgi:hypothetical protein